MPSLFLLLSFLGSGFVSIPPGAFSSSSSSTYTRVKSETCLSMLTSHQEISRRYFLQEEDHDPLLGGMYSGAEESCLGSCLSCKSFPDSKGEDKHIGLSGVERHVGIHTVHLPW